jgi:hypothetical protein
MKGIENHFRRHVALHDKIHKEEEVLEMHRLVENFIVESGERLVPTLFKQAIEKAKGLSTLQRGEKQWSKHGHVDAYLFPANQCRDESVTDSQILNESLHDFDIRQTKVYSVNKPGEPDKPPMLSDVMEQLHNPDPSNAKYAVNLGQGRGVKRPIDMAVEVTDSEMITTCNITPQGSFVDLHIGEYGI